MAVFAQEVQRLNDSEADLELQRFRKRRQLFAQSRDSFARSIPSIERGQQHGGECVDAGAGQRFIDGELFECSQRFGLASALGERTCVEHRGVECDGVFASRARRLPRGVGRLLSGVDLAAAEEHLGLSQPIVRGGIDLFGDGGEHRELVEFGRASPSPPRKRGSCATGIKARHSSVACPATSNPLPLASSTASASSRRPFATKARNVARVGTRSSVESLLSLL